MKNKVKNAVWGAVCFLVISPGIVFGQNSGGIDSPTSTTLPNPLGGTNSLTVLMDNILKVVKTIGGIAVVFFIIYAGYLFVMAQGNETKLEEAKKTLLYTVIGALIILGVSVIQAVIKGTLTDLGVGL
jgi:peptidoglycan/LPS O-acetylase OafA/YrhL